MESIKVLNLDFRGISNIIQTLKAVQYDDGRAVRVMFSGTQGILAKLESIAKSQVEKKRTQRDRSLTIIAYCLD